MAGSTTDVIWEDFLQLVRSPNRGAQRSSSHSTSVSDSAGFVEPRNLFSIPQNNSIRPKVIPESPRSRPSVQNTLPRPSVDDASPRTHVPLNELFPLFRRVVNMVKELEGM